MPMAGSPSLTIQELSANIFSLLNQPLYKSLPSLCFFRKETNPIDKKVLFLVEDPLSRFTEWEGDRRKGKRKYLSFPFYVFSRVGRKKLTNFPSLVVSQKEFYFKMMISRPCQYINLVRMMQRALLRSKLIRPYYGENEFEEQRKKARCVKDGHFAIFAVKCEKPKRFVIKLKYLQYPAFLKLLEQAEEEYGFQHEGALTVPCSPEDFQKIMQSGR